MVGLCVSPADIQDRDMIAPLLKIARRMFPSLARAIADGGYQGTATAVAVRIDAKIPLEIVKRSDTAKGFTVLPKRWIVERTFGWFGRCRRLAEGLREPRPVARRLRHFGHDPHHVAADRKAQPNIIKAPDGLLDAAPFHRQTRKHGPIPWDSHMFRTTCPTK
jgi:transposase